MTKVSVIIPTFNRQEYIQRAIKSVLAQTYKDFEIIVVNDGSTDNTVEILKLYLPKIKLINIENSGVSFARNLGVKNSNGDLIAFLDSDDEWLPQKLEKQMKFHENNLSIPLIHGEELWVRNGKRVNPKNKHKKSGGFIIEKCLPMCVISPSATIINRDIYNEFCGFREDYPACEDYDLWLKVCSKYEIGFIEEPIIIKYGGHSDQLSAKFIGMDYWRINSLIDLLEYSKIDILRSTIIKLINKKLHILEIGSIKHDNQKMLKNIKTLKMRLTNYK